MAIIPKGVVNVAQQLNDVEKLQRRDAHVKVPRRPPVLAYLRDAERNCDPHEQLHQRRTALQK